MALARRIGPVKGAGVAVIETTPGNAITPSSFGTTAFIGQFERGDINAVSSPQYNDTTSAENFKAQMGGRIDDSTAPDCVQDFWSHGAGAGRAICVRVTDGDELTPETVLFSRDWGTDFHASESLKGNAPQIKRSVLKVKAKNAGRWAGRARVFTGEMTTPASELTDTTLTTLSGTGLFKANEFTGATVTFEGVSFRTYTVLTNTADGVFTVETGSTMKTDYDNSGTADKTYRIELENTTLDSGSRKGLAVRIRPADEDQSNLFGLEVIVNGEVVKTYGKLSMDATSQYYVESVINDDTSNYYVEVTDLWNAQGPITSDIRPANFYGRADTVSATGATFSAAQVVSVSDANIHVAGFNWPSGADPKPHRLTFTFAYGSPATYAYSVVATSLDQPKNWFKDLPGFTIGSGAQLQNTYTAANIHTVGLILDHASTPADGATIVIDVIPLDPDVVVGAEFYPDAVNSPLVNHRVKSATYNSVTVESGTPSDTGSSATVAAVTSTNTETFAIVGATNDGFTFAVDGRTAVTGTLTAGPARTAAQIAADINGAFDAAYGVGVLNPASASSAGAVVITSPGGVDSGGPGSVVRVVAVPADCYAILGFTEGYTYGTEGSEVELMFAQEPAGGHDGGTPAAQDYMDALSISDSPLNDLFKSGLGVIQISVPGVTTTTVQKQGISYAEEFNYMFHVLVPSTTTADADVVAYINDTIGRSDFACTFFPSFVSVNDPDNSGLLKEIPITGMVIGRDAKYARNFGGYFRPAAGIDATLPRILKLPTLDRVPDGELLTPHGVNLILKKSGNWVIWGGRTISRNTASQWRNQRLQLSHYEHTFLSTFDWVIFMLNNARTRTLLHSAFRAYFIGEFAAGAIEGDSVDDAAVIKIDEENNPALSVAAGDLNASITLTLVNFVERFIITVGQGGVFEATT